MASPPNTPTKMWQKYDIYYIFMTEQLYIAIIKLILCKSVKPLVAQVSHGPPPQLGRDPMARPLQQIKPLQYVTTSGPRCPVEMGDSGLVLFYTHAATTDTYTISVQHQQHMTSMYFYTQGGKFIHLDGMHLDI